MTEPTPPTPTTNDSWLNELQKLYEADKVKQETAEAEAKRVTERQQQAAQIMQDSRAHELLRQVQKALLSGQGVLRFYTNAGGYDQAVALLWQGPISRAEKPVKDEKADGLILVGTRDGELWVNEAPLLETTPQALKEALLEACRELVAPPPDATTNESKV